MKKNKKPIELDRWESQLIWYAKGWLEDDEKNPIDITMEKALKNLWGNRCGLLSEHVHISYVARPLLKLLIKLNLFSNLDHALSEMIEGMDPQNKWSRDPNYTDSDSYYLRICWVCLYTFLSNIQVYNSTDQTDPRFIMLPFEPHLFMKAEYDKEEN